MPASPEQIADLVSNPRESLNVELKSWIDPSHPDGIAKIVKACIALRNNDGGFLLIGFNDKTLEVERDGAPLEINRQFHPDIVQGLVAKYASRPFETYLHFPEVSGATVVVIEVEAGVRVPVAVKSDLLCADKKLLACDRVYVRTLQSNNRVSTSEARWKDWEQLSEVCFRNREADVGAFLRRHLVGLSAESIEALGSGLLNAIKPPPPLEDEGRHLLDSGYSRFESAISKRPPLTDFPRHGTWEIAVRVNPPFKGHRANQAFLNSVLLRNPGYSGWPAWIDTRESSEQQRQPYVSEGGWEALIITEPRISWHLDFWRIEPEGVFYLRRGLQEDLSVGNDSPQPQTILDFSLAIRKTAEAVAVALAFAQALDSAETERVLTVACRWNGLNGRELTSWTDRLRTIFPGKRCRENSIITATLVSGSAAPTSLSEPVQELVAPLFELFNGFELAGDVFTDIIQRMLKRQ